VLPQRQYTESFRILQLHKGVRRKPLGGFAPLLAGLACGRPLDDGFAHRAPVSTTIRFADDGRQDYKGGVTRCVLK